MRAPPDDVFRHPAAPGEQVAWFYMRPSAIAFDSGFVTCCLANYFGEVAGRYCVAAATLTGYQTEGNKVRPGRSILILQQGLRSPTSIRTVARESVFGSRFSVSLGGNDGAIRMFLSSGSFRVWERRASSVLRSCSNDRCILGEGGHSLGL